ncbi:MAG: SurA N-terminal domain-containing protein [Rhodospirillaceae bacterium]|nr:SurA N-terminal domain-containing protein [Rhodospirillaceae bacterium]
MSNSVGRFFTTLLAKILFGILIIAFGAWGIADMLRRSPEHEAVITVGDVEVSGRQVKRAFVAELRRLRQRFGPQLTAAEAAKFGVFDQVLSQIASRALLDAAAKDMNIGASDAAIQALITKNAAFLAEDGTFSRERFQRVLENNGYTEIDFLTMTRGDMTRQRILNSVREPVVAPTILVDTLLRYEGERRVADVFALKSADMPVLADPGDDVLTAYQKAHAAQYTAPETRKLSVLPIRPEDVQKRLEISDDDLHAYFDSHATELLEPEQRKLRQILVKDESTAEKVAAALKEGRSPEVVAKDSKAVFSDLGWVGRDGLLSNLAEPAFAAEKGNILAPLKTALGWHVVMIDDVRPAHQPEFKAVKDKIVAAVKSEQTLAALYNASTALEDAIAAGATLEEAAKLNELKVVTLDAVDAKGETPEGKAVTAIPAVTDIVKAGFAQEAGEQSPLTEYEGEPGGYFVIRTDAVTPATLRPFVEVRAALLAAWRTEKQQEAVVEKAKTLAEAFATDKDIKAFAKANHVSIDSTQPIFRSSGGRDLPRDLVKALFTLEPGQTSSAATSDGAMVARLSTIQPVDLNDFKGAIEQGKQQLRSALGDSLMMPFTTQLTDSFQMRQFRSVDNLIQELN